MGQKVRSFSALEERVMDALWQRGGTATVLEIVEDLAKTRSLAYTTVMTVVERLRTKGWVDRVKEGRAYVYTATRSEDEYTAGLMNLALCSASDRSAALLSFAGQLDPAQAETLRKALAKRISKSAPR